MKTKGFTKRMLTIVMMVLISVMMVFPAHAASKVKLNYTKKTIAVGQKVNLKVKGTSAKVKWSSSKKSVAAVSSKGVVTARKAGTAKIKAAVKGKTYTCKVTVKDNVFTSPNCPFDVAPVGNGVSFYVTKMQYSGNKLIVDGFFMNKTGRRITALKNYKIKIYVTLSDGRRVQLTDGMFNMMNVNIPAGVMFGYRYVTLGFCGKGLMPTVYDLTKAQSYDVVESGIY